MDSELDERSYFFPCVAALAVFMLTLGGVSVYSSLNWLNPDSRFCRFAIYATPDGKYELWNNGRVPWLRGVYRDYATAKSNQVELCRELREFDKAGPRGKRVR